MPLLRFLGGPLLVMATNGEYHEAATTPEHVFCASVPSHAMVRGRTFCGNFTFLDSSVPHMRNYRLVFYVCLFSFAQRVEGLVAV